MLKPEAEKPEQVLALNHSSVGLLSRRKVVEICDVAGGGIVGREMDTGGNGKSCS